MKVNQSQKIIKNGTQNPVKWQHWQLANKQANNLFM
jgi:hypothetical protein